LECAVKMVTAEAAATTSTAASVRTTANVK
jgi:hypothetical protein